MNIENKLKPIRWKRKEKTSPKELISLSQKQEVSYTTYPKSFLGSASVFGIPVPINYYLNLPESANNFLGIKVLN